MSHIKDLIVNGVTRVLGKLIANEISTSSIKTTTSSLISGTKYFATNGTIRQLVFIPGEGEYSAISYPSNQAGPYSIAEGYNTTASGDYSHAEGYYTKASGTGSHAGGYIYGGSIEASGIGSFAHGYSSKL